MRRLVVGAILAVCVVAAMPAVGGEAGLDFRVQRLSDRVLMFTEVSPWESNHVVIVGAEGMVLVDPGHSALMGRLIREAVAGELGRDRFAYVIDTHGHWGHTWGNAAFPEAMVVGHERAAETMRADGANLEPRAEFFRGQVERTAAPSESSIRQARRRGRQARAGPFRGLVTGLGETGFAVQPPG